MKKNLTEKSIAIILAIFIWSYFQFSLTETQTYRQIAIKLKANQNQLITSVDTNSLTVILKGPRETLNKISNKDFFIEKTLPQQINPGLQQIEITPKDVKLINKISNVSIDSVIGKVICYADNIISKTVKIQPTYESFLDSNYEVKAKITNPHLKIFGPSLILKDLLILKTIPVTVEGYNTTNFAKSAFIETIKDVTLEHKKVTISFDINEKQALINLVGIPINIIFLGKQDSLIDSKIPTAEITLILPPNTIQQLNPQEDFKLFIEIPQSPTKNDSYTVKFMTKVDRLKAKKIFPSKIQLKTKKL